MTNSTVSRMRWLRAALLLSWAGLAPAQIYGPISGHIFHSPTNSIRPILGVPGGAVVSGPIVRDIQFGAISRDGRWALVRRAESAAMVKLGAAESEELPLAGLDLEVDMAAWSGSGEVVIACSSARKTLQAVRFSGGRWTAGPPVDLGDLEGRLTSLSSNFAGDRIAVGLTDAQSGGLYLVSGGVPVLLMPASLPVTAVFAPRTETLYAAGALAGAVEVFENGARVGLLSPSFENAADAGVAGMAPSDDGMRLFVAYKDLPGLFAFDLVSGLALPEHRLEAAPTALSPMAGGRWLVLNSPRAPNEPVVLVQDREPAAAYFIPIEKL
jgi:hypothetical protein